MTLVFERPETLAWIVLVVNAVIYVGSFALSKLRNPPLIVRRLHQWTIVATITYSIFYSKHDHSKEASSAWAYALATALTFPFTIIALFATCFCGTSTAVSLISYALVGGSYFSGVIYFFAQSQIGNSITQIMLALLPVLLYAALVPLAYRHPNIKDVDRLPGEAEGKARKAVLIMLWFTESLTASYLLVVGIRQWIYGEMDEFHSFVSLEDEARAYLCIAFLFIVRFSALLYGFIHRSHHNTYGTLAKRLTFMASDADNSQSEW